MTLVLNTKLGRPSRPFWREPVILLVGGTLIAAAAVLLLHMHTAGTNGGALVVATLAFAGLAAASLAYVGRAVAESRRSGLNAGMLEQIADALPEPLLVVDPQGETVYLNRGMAALIGEAGGAGAFMRLREHFCVDADSAKQFARLEQAAAAGSRARAEIGLDAPDGRAEWFELGVFPLPWLQGYVIWTAADVTARRQMLDAIRDERRRFSDFLENAPIGFYSVDEDGRFLFVNGTLARWLGADAGRIVAEGARLHDFVAGALPASALPFSALAADDGGQGIVELRRGDGSTFEAHIAQTIASDPDTGRLRTRSVVRDLSAERRDESSMRLSEQRFHRVFEQSPIGVTLLDQRGIITETNPAFAALVRGNEQRLVGSDFLALVRPGDRDDLAARLAQVAAGETVQMPIEIRLAGSGERTCAAYAQPLGTGPDGAVLLLELLDTSRQKALEMQFAQSQKMLAVGQLAGGIAHDFNNLLTAMIGFCDLLLLRHQPGDQSFSDIMQIKQNANRAANLVRQLLAFSRQQTLQPRVLNLTDVLADLSNLLRRLIGASIDLRMQHGRDLGLVRVDQVQLEQIIMNLAVNGRDAMPNGGVLTIRTSNARIAAGAARPGREAIAPGDYVLIEVIDTGVGIPPEHIDRIFEPFFSTKEVGSGTGLGLSTVYGIVKQFEGYVFVDSTPGQGAGFSIYLPLYRGAAEDGPSRADLAAPPAADTSGVGTVLLVEDEDPVRLFSARALRNKGYKVLEARSGDTALELLTNAEERVDVMVTDVVMPRMDGPTLIGKVREQYPDMRIICISGYAEGSFRQKLEGFPGIHFLPKPFSLQQLAGKVKEVMAAPVR